MRKMKANMDFLFKKIRRYPLSCVVILTIWILCLIPIPETPLSHISLIDKWTHLAFYGGLCMITWVEYGRQHPVIDQRTALLWMVIAPILMGGLIEIVQATCTGGNRSGDWIDWGADTIGVMIGQLIGIPLARVLSRKQKDS